MSWGAPGLGDLPVPADYDADGKANVAVFRTTTGQLFIAHPSGAVTTTAWGAPPLGDIAVPFAFAPGRP